MSNSIFLYQTYSLTGSRLKVVMVKGDTLEILKTNDVDILLCLLSITEGLIRNTSKLLHDIYFVNLITDGLWSTTVIICRLCYKVVVSLWTKVLTFLCWKRNFVFNSASMLSIIILFLVFLGRYF